MEGTLLVAHIIGYLTAVFLVLSPVQAVAFVLVQQGLFGIYLGCSFAPNHKGMPVLGEDEKIDFLRRQVITSRNIRGGWFTDFALGGLNYQIEHHLFPSMPRPSLRHAQEPVRAFCEQHGIAYHETGLFASYAQVLRHLHAVGGRCGRTGILAAGHGPRRPAPEPASRCPAERSGDGHCEEQCWMSREVAHVRV